MILLLSYYVSLLNLAVGKLASVPKMTIAGRKPVSAHLSFVLVDITLIFLFLGHLILTTLRTASLIGIVRYKFSD